MIYINKEKRICCLNSNPGWTRERERERVKARRGFFIDYFFAATIIVGSFLFLLPISSKPVKAAQTTLQVEIPTQVIVSTEGQTIQTVFSNLGRLPTSEKISWKEQGQIVVPNDKLIQKFWMLSAALDWEKAGIIYKNQTIWEKISSLLL